MAAFNRAILFLVVVMAAAEMFGNAAAATYVVGDSLGWRVPPGGAADYAAWASQHVFRDGDILVFNFNTGVHDVAKVAQGAYDGCASTNPIALATVGPASFTLNSTGPDFYICTFGQHCSLGQKLTINVTSPSTTPTPAPSPSTTMPPPTTMPVSPAPAPSPHTVMPTPTTSPSGAPSPSSNPSPAPGSNTTPSTSPTSETSPESGPSPSSTSTGDLSPPPPPNSATITTIRAPIIIFALIIFGLAI